MNISRIIVHRLRQDSNGLVELHCRDKALALNDTTETLIEELHGIYNRKGGKAWASFTEVEAESGTPFAELLDTYLKDNSDFVTFSSQAGERLVTAINRYEVGQEGYLVVAHYQVLAIEYLFIGLLGIGESMAVNEQLEVNRASSLALERFGLAARIDLAALEQTGDNATPAISFIKGRAGRKIADFFLEFLGCEELVDSKEETQALMHAVEEYCSEIQLDKKEAGELKQKLVNHCKQQIGEGESVKLQDISEDLETDAPTSFYDFAMNMEQPLRQEIPVEAAPLRKMVKMSGSGGGMSISFDSHLLGDLVEYDPGSDTLTIKQLPASLRKQIQKHLGLGND